MMRPRIILLLIVALQVASITAHAQQVTIPGSETRKLTSAIVSGQEYELQVLLPAGYEKSTKKYPVLFLMDSQWDFPLLKALYGEQYFDGFIPEMIIVGITWGGVNPNPDSLRARDYTPTKENRVPQSGGAGVFLSCIKKEIIPYIEGHYRADKNDRALIGCSLGGLFTLYALFTEPGLFQRYVAASPAFGWDREVIYQYEEKYFASNPAASARLFLIMGGVERNESGFEKLVNHLSARHYQHLQFKSRVLENTGHSGTKAEGYARGMQYVYERPSLELSDVVLNTYSGTYSTSYGDISIKNEDHHLVLYFGEANKYILYAAAENEFYATSEFLNIHFSKQKDKINGFQLDRFTGSQFVTRK